MLEELKTQLNSAISRGDSTLVEECLETLEQLEGNEAKALTLRVKGFLAHFRGDLEGAGIYFADALQNPPEDLWVKAVILVNMGSVKQELGEGELALSYFHEALELYGQIEDHVGEARLHRQHGESLQHDR
jgi:tetratricopeptide (TPR) repeat protein